ncbi:MAG: DUF177 domain-containing protein [Bacteriovoracaceae bacterium]
MNNHSENKLAQKVNLTQLASDKAYHYDLNQSTEWIREILLELNEKAASRNPEDYLGETDLTAQLELKKTNNATFGPVLLVKGKVETEFVTECVRTLVEMKERLEVEFKACFVENIFAEDEEYADQVDVFIDNDVYDLHFYELNRADFKEMLHEVIFLNINPYPVADYDTPLDQLTEKGGAKQ